MRSSRPRLIALIAVIAGACATPVPTETDVPSSVPSPTRSDRPAPSEPPALKVGDWSVTCDGVPADDCAGVAALYVGNLARSWKSVFDESGGTLVVEPRPDCPAAPGQEPSRGCWEASASVSDGSVCMVIARQPTSRPPGFGQVGGDAMSGRAGDPPRGWLTCD